MTALTNVRGLRRRGMGGRQSMRPLIDRWLQSLLGLGAGALAGSMIAHGGFLALIAVMGTCALLGIMVHRCGPSVLPLAAVAVGAIPALLALPMSVVVAGKSLYFGDILLPAAAVLALTRRSRVPGIDLAAWFYVLVFAFQTAVGVARNQPFNAFTQDLRGPVYLVCGYLVASRLYNSAHVRRYLVTAGAILWYSASLMFVTIATGVQLFAARTEEVRAYGASGPELLDATRFVVESKGLAFITVVAAGAVLLSSSSTPRHRRIAAILFAPALVVTFLNYARASILAIIVCVALLTALNRLVGVNGRALGAGALALGAVVGLVGLTGTTHVINDPEGNVFARQVAGFDQRVLEGLTSEDLQSPGNTYRLKENGSALEAIAKNPVFGHGVGAAFKPVTYGDPALQAFEDNPAFGVRFIHNGWLWYLVKTGAVGLIAFLLLTLVPIVAAIRTVRRSGIPAPLVMALAASVVGLMVILIFEPDLHRVGTAPIAGAVLGYLALRSSGTPHGLALDRSAEPVRTVTRGYE